MRRGDAIAVGFAAHSLRGSAANFMATETVDAAQALELAAGTGDLDLARGAVETLKRNVQRLIDELGELNAVVH